MYQSTDPGMTGATTGGSGAGPGGTIAKAGGSAFVGGAKKFGNTMGKGFKKVGKKTAVGLGVIGGFLIGKGSRQSPGGGTGVYSREGEFNASAVWFFVIISLTVHVLDYIGNAFIPSMRVIIYIAMAFLAYMLFQRALQATILRAAILITVVNLFMPNFLRFSFGISNEIVLLFIIWLPMWPLYISLMAKEDVKFIGFLALIWILFCFILTLNYFLSDNAFFLGAAEIDIRDSLRARRTFLDELNRFIATSTEEFRSIPTKIQESWNRSIDYATGGYYRGQEERVVEPLGVFMRDVKPTSNKYFEGDKITIWGTLRARNIGRRPIEVFLECGLVDTWKISDIFLDERIYAEPVVFPERFSMEGYDQVNIDCVFENGLPDWGRYQIMLNATFSFETQGRMLTYWIDSKSARSITREGETVHRVYDLYENPISYFTSGPVRIGLGIANQPIKVGEEKPIIGITIESNWDRGRIAKVNEFKIKVPEQVSLRHTDCSEIVIPGGREEGFNVYYVDVNNHRFENIRDYKTVICHFNDIGPNVLDPNSPITLRYIKAEVSYDYVIYQTLQINVDRDPTIKQDEIGVGSGETTGVITPRDESSKICSGTEDGYKYDCVPMNVPDSCGGEWSTRTCTRSGTRCCRTKI